MKVWLAVAGCVAAGLAVMQPTLAGPVARGFLIAALGVIAAVVIWPKVRAYPLARTAAYSARALPQVPAVPTELQRLDNEIRVGRPSQPLGTNTLLHLRYVARFRLVSAHGIDPDDWSNQGRITQAVGPHLCAIVSPWPPDQHGAAQPPAVASHELAAIIERLVAL